LLFANGSPPARGSPGNNTLDASITLPDKPTYPYNDRENPFAASLPAQMGGLLIGGCSCNAAVHGAGLWPGPLLRGDLRGAIVPIPPEANSFLRQRRPSRWRPRRGIHHKLAPHLIDHSTVPAARIRGKPRLA